MIAHFIKNKANYQLRKGSYAKTPEKQVKFWKTKGLDSNKLFQVDGSGMSMKNA